MALRFDNRFIQSLPGDPIRENRTRQVEGACYSRVMPTPVRAPQLVTFADDVAAQLDLTAEDCRSAPFLAAFSGNELLPGMEPFAMCYGGHQFGHWAGQLGDGRAINLGEVNTQRGEHFTLQLKGAGPTPYSRRADGLAVLRSSLREFLCSEAMHHLGVPTTRALSLVLTGEDVIRDVLYDGHPMPEPGAIVCRVAPSFVRFGNFEIFAARGDIATLQKFVDYTIQRDFAHLGAPSAETYGAFFREVCKRTAELMVHWQRVGFVHGVMNTDNMSILGMTIDYGPYGWLENYDPDWTPNTTDYQHSRYRYGHQPDIALWNLAQLGNALYPLVGDVAPLQAALDTYLKTYEDAWESALAAKLGFSEWTADDHVLANDLFELLQRTETDMPIFFRRLSDVDVANESLTAESLFAPLREAYYRPEELVGQLLLDLQQWCIRYALRARQETSSAAVRKASMDAVNPKYVLRNYLAQLAIDDAEKGDLAYLHTLQSVLQQPYVEQPGMEQFALKRPEWARSRVGCSMLSCSS
jgi:uncharacterized protein YdiU (UPF0061 family)